MNRSEFRWAHAATSGLLATLLLGLAGCSAEEPSPAPPSRPPVVQAEAAPLPDFRSFVVGDLQEPEPAGRDPFSEAKSPPPAVANSAPRHRAKPRLELRGIVERDGQSVALFDRGSVRVGERIAGWTVERIDERTVLMRRGDRRQRWSL
jgi:hypothetical protein